MTAKRRRELNHYLITVSVFSDAHLHCYLMTDEGQTAATAAGEHMLDLAEAKGWPVLIQMILVTKLATDGGMPDQKSIDIVRKIICEHELVRRKLETETDYHCTIWMMRAADDEELMRLH